MYTCVDTCALSMHVVYCCSCSPSFYSVSEYSWLTVPVYVKRSFLLEWICLTVADLVCVCVCVCVCVFGFVEATEVKELN